jgi:hypothetical protein
VTAAISRLVSPRREALLAGGLACAVAAVLVAFAPKSGDAPAHLYRTLLVREGVLVWDNLWYGGHYPLASYSLLYYLPAALVGNLPLVFAAVVLSAAFFAALVEREWGEAGRWPARVFGILAAGPIFLGTYSYALGLAAGLGALCALQRGRRWLAAGAAALTLGFSPLAFMFLCLVLLALFLVRGRFGRSALVFGSVIAAIAAVQLLALELFPSGGDYPFRALELVAVLTVSALGATLARGARHGALLAAFFLVWGSASVIMFEVATPIGENLTRLRSLVFPLMLLTGFVARFSPRWLAALALSAALVYNVAPYAAPAIEGTDLRPAHRAFWGPAIEFLESSSPNYRVEVVPTFDHWEAYWLPSAGIPIARGWYRQIDMAQNKLFYQRPLAAPSYRDWLRRMGVRFVVLPHTRLGQKGEKREAALLRSGLSGLRPVFLDGRVTIYELPRPDPILNGPGVPRITYLDHSRVAGRLTKAGTFALKIRYTRYWTVRTGAVCVERGTGGMTRIKATRRGRFVLRVPENPDDLVGFLVGRPGAHC